jgi:hypothetical protein
MTIASSLSERLKKVEDAKKRLLTVLEQMRESGFNIEAELQKIKNDENRLSDYLNKVSKNDSFLAEFNKKTSQLVEEMEEMRSTLLKQMTMFKKFQSINRDLHEKLKTLHLSEPSMRVYWRWLENLEYYERAILSSDSHFRELYIKDALDSQNELFQMVSTKKEASLRLLRIYGEVPDTFQSLAGVMSLITALFIGILLIVLPLSTRVGFGLINLLINLPFPIPQISDIIYTIVYCVSLILVSILIIKFHLDQRLSKRTAYKIVGVLLCGVFLNIYLLLIVLPAISFLYLARKIYLY